MLGGGYHHTGTLIVDEADAISVSFCGNQIFEYPDTEDGATAILRMENGAFFTVEANFNVPDNIGGCRFDIYGTQGRITAEGTLGQTETGTLTLATQDDVRTLTYDTTNMYTKEIDALVDAIVGNTAEPVDAASAIFDQRIVEAVYESQESGRHIRL